MLVPPEACVYGHLRLRGPDRVRTRARGAVARVRSFSAAGTARARRTNELAMIFFFPKFERSSRLFVRFRSSRLPQPARSVQFRGSGWAPPAAFVRVRSSRNPRERQRLRYCVHQHHKSSLSPAPHSLSEGGHNYRSAITGMISGKWGGWYGIPSRAGALWVAVGGGAGGLAEALAELLPQARARMTHVE